jgi:hypothetical protein
MLKELFREKQYNTKQKADLIAGAILEGQLSIKDLITYAAFANDSDKATCIEGLEHATKIDPLCITREGFAFICKTLKEKPARVKWESARAIGNCVRAFPEHLEEPITNLLDNTEHSGMVVRWSAAYALGEILKLKTDYNTDLLPALQAICQGEDRPSIKKIYLEAIKKAK